ncbi:MAG TPA: RNA methyltransferase [Ornithinimicrobium sp.]|uniref:TrmH family RNA methyltransferase n=1 Tax=Ornithinimicrobium sp. TaxID=1977084 RepID=UPI002B45C869|nr:RNA methyltransferase [Ornithinimicrobium sp.]HKJ12945.1 RNA methyltransferase [Ornithinimicrobium sp.]
MSAVDLNRLPRGVTAIHDAADTRVRDYFGLTDVALRRTLEPRAGLYIAESAKVIARAVGAGHRMRSLLLAPRWLDDLAELVAACANDGVPVYVAAAEVIQQMTGFHLHRGALASMHRPVLPAAVDLLGGAHRVLVLEDIVDHTNVGALFRSAAALGADAVMVTPRCADPLYRRSIRVSMGTVFQVPWTRLSHWPQDVELLRGHGFVVAACTLAPDAMTLTSLASRPPPRLALVLGTEGDGLSDRTQAAADLSVAIPMAGGVDSLNVAAAGAVLLWALRSRSAQF